MVDVRHHQQNRRGAGRLNNVTGSTLYPNVRLSGPADFPEIYYVGDLLKDQQVRALADNRLSRLLNMVDRDEQKALPYIAAAFLGDTQLALGLVIPTYLLRRGELDYSEESQAQDTVLQKALGLLFDESLGAYSGHPQEGAGQALGLDIQLMARQMG